MRTPPFEQYFTNEEYQQRLEALRSRIEQQGADVMLVNTPENLYYLTGYQTPGYYWYQTLIVPLDREPVFIARSTESTNVDLLTWVEDSRPYVDFDDWIARTTDALTDLGLDSKRIGLENRSFFITIDDYQRLMTRLPSATFVDCSGLVEEGRVTKSPQELEYIRQAAKVADAAMLAGIEAAAPGVTENEVAAEVHRAQILAGGEYTGLPAFIASGPRSWQTHATWNRRTLQNNEQVLFEIPGCINRYHAALFRPVYLGDPPASMIRAVEAQVQILQECKDMIKPGVKAGDVHNFAQRRLKETLGVERGPRLGYSIGIAFPPDWGEGYIISMWEGEQRPFKPGMTFHLLPGVAIEGVGPVNVTDTIHVTEDGCETLTNGVERKLFVK